MKLIHLGAGRLNSRINVTITRNEYNKILGATGRQVTYLFIPHIVKKLPDKIAKYMVKKYEDIIEFKPEAKTDKAKEMVDEYTINQLRTMTGKKGLSTKGTKVILAERLCKQHLHE